MKKLAILIVLALEIAVCGCGGNTTSTTQNPTTSTNGNWEAQLINGTGQASLLNFVVSFSVNNTGPLDITGLSFFNQNSCFQTGLNTTTESGTATLSTTNAGTVSGPFTLTITAAGTGTALALTGTITGTSNGTTTTTGTLSAGSVVGNWTLKPGASADSSCTPVNTGTFIMCQGATTCTPTGASDTEAVEKF
ncbi:MAG TPA: hypothetical protein VMP68_24675 [Candidatus Eisenbacteria bacterium]|nr:hypothetical protein [Candidatus Eisenbacteria bacterium]